ncbi:hypothetical protein DUZ99_14105 [Xylanibacillus composti]|uniref:GyrI-like small molecule binding domain-containing protein n=1 Tax=Xylanibacillus composti TaxID=1572762 RepID=A0A8J4H3A6_9BACL|nr:GyrI-like domain-containing protein [Xylanibacillus composti]MDT9726112.1 hypothetical protein [Xylanibacillus composti]GIQ68741.1 hypothetical protein XYCOK13_15650 [Xylanibacillus composti]
MSKKVDYKKDFKHLYVPGTSPEILEVGPMPYFILQGEGDPNTEPFAQATEALYSMSYAVKMSYKSDNVPAGYYAYTVFPLEGIWDLIDYAKPATDKSNLRYTLMIRQPDFMNEALFTRYLEQTKAKKTNPRLDDIVFSEVADGLSCQMMHIGSYDEEPASFARMEAFCEQQGYVRTSLTHREIYLSDPRKTAPYKRKTVLRFSVEKR